MFKATLCVALQDFLDFLPIHKSGRACQSWYIVSCQTQHSLWLAATLPDSPERLHAILKNPNLLISTASGAENSVKLSPGLGLCVLRGCKSQSGALQTRP